jgi:hypothetical protein
VDSSNPIFTTWFFVACCVADLWHMLAFKFIMSVVCFFLKKSPFMLLLFLQCHIA